ncbi:MAG TPA: hypothetical protein VFM55_18075 [Micromonosporaceae bacterium]|nr:hypothetical protein [Micromonosporaceae bacterium]
MTTTRTKTKLPAPFYAAAGAGDLAYRRLRALAPKSGELHLRDELDKVRERTRRGAKAFLGSAQAGAQAAQHRAAAVYTDLVQHGKRVMAGETGYTSPTARPVEPAAMVEPVPAVTPAPAAKRVPVEMAVVDEPAPAVVEPAPAEAVEAMATVAEAASRPAKKNRSTGTSTTTS